jgi:hypothetical protein
MNTMRGSQAVVAAFLGAGVALAVGWNWNVTAQTRVAAPSGAASLPGAIAVIDAANYESLQAAIDAVGPRGGVVQLPPGLFEIDQPLVIPHEDFQLRGSGTATHIKNVNQEGQPAISIRPDALADNPRARQWRVHLSDLRITGNGKSGHGIEALGVNEIYLEGLTVSNHGSDGIFMKDCYEDPRVIGCLITYNKRTGLALHRCHDIVVSASQFEENHDALHCFDGFNLCMTGNCLDDHLGNGVVIENTYGSNLTGNMIEECQGTAVVLDRNCYGIAVSANCVAHNFGGGIDLRDAHGCTLSANVLTIMGKFAVRIGPDSGRITVTGNSLSDSYLGDGQHRRDGEPNAGGLILESTQDVCITGNGFSGNRPKSVQLLGKSNRRVLMAGNLVTDASGDESQLDDASLVTGNLLSEEASP